MRRAIIVFMVLLLCSSASLRASGRENVWFSVLYPGWGQIRDGRIGRGALLASVELMTLTALVVSNVQYDRAVEQYDRAKAQYLGATYIGDAVEQYNIMNEKWDDADKLDTYRKALVGTAVGVWAIGVLDMVLWGHDDGEPPVTLEVGREGFLVTKAFSF